MPADIEQAMSLIENGDVKAGLDKLEEIEKVASDDETLELAAAYQSLGHPHEVIRIVDRLLQSYPNEGSLLTLKAEAAVDLDREEEAIDLLESVTVEDESFLEAQMLLADLYQTQGLEEVAERKLFMALEQAPDEPILLAGLGSYYVEQGNYQNAIPYLKQAIQQGFDPSEANVNVLLAEAYSNTGAFETAIPYYAEAVEEDEDPRALFGYGFTALQLNDYSTAIEQLENLKKLDPEYSSLYSPLIEAYEAERQFENALQTAEAGLEVDRHNEHLYAETGRLQQALGQFEHAEQSLKQALEYHPGNLGASAALLRMYADEERSDDIKTLIDQLRAAGEEDPLFTFYEGKAHYIDDEVEEALPFYEQAYAYIETDGGALEEYGHLLLENGRQKDAKMIFSRAAQLQPENHELQLFVEELQSREQ
ncbi:tetratricopeptide (TPR) repeat protein [Geomicrobium halophilum]|uniref:Tetratricopeptide (TPR) repeat protein n=1 Tax=Geomicrobium halophilum TaxID=549000 RepID=A0A841PJZ4_9BACL|nr:tetratricopeptide repeat protein [Geomicrobium halophilum]MBB6449049.1 tetratricopeptide (TPR) repeat protein [Geomicrobium halophilum]